MEGTAGEEDLRPPRAADAGAVVRALKVRARELGLECGVAPPRVPDVELERLEAWLRRGDHAGLVYLAKAPRERASAAVGLLPDARSVVMVALPYPPELDPEAPGPIASYARGADYHKVLGERLEALGQHALSLLPGAHFRRFVDTAPILERAFAHAAGLGFYGKNACLIHPRLGSYFFLGGLALDRELPPDGPLADMPSCGQCRLCLDACPTGAIPEPFRVDSRRCISYLTIEHRGPYDEALRPLVGERVFGCDVCQAVCPWNEKFAPPGDPAFAPWQSLAGPLGALLARLEARWKSSVRGTPLPHGLKRGFLRNAATSLAGTTDPTERAALARLADHEDEGVREHARWALARPPREG